MRLSIVQAILCRDVGDTSAESGVIVRFSDRDSRLGEFLLADAAQGVTEFGEQFRMRCNPLRWLWGLLPLAVWLWITALSERSHIETDLTKRTQDALNAAGLSWASPSFAGRDGAILGRAHDDAEPGKALEVAKGVWGVRIANAQTELIEKVETYLWSAATRDGSAVR